MVDRAFGAAMKTDIARYTELWDGLTTNQRRLLEALGQAGSDEEVLSENFRQRQRLGAYATAERALESLVERGLVEREGRSRIVIPDVFLRHWLRLPSSG
jgi:DNA-binding MarR family transcriptional regulator